MIDEVPFADPEGLLDWVEHHLTTVTPLILERLLTHNGFVDAGTMPTTLSVPCSVWKHQEAESTPALADARVLVYHYELVSERAVRVALRMIEKVRHFERLRALRGGKL